MLFLSPEPPLVVEMVGSAVLLESVVVELELLAVWDVLDGDTSYSSLLLSSHAAAAADAAADDLFDDARIGLNRKLLMLPPKLLLLLFFFG